MYDETLDHKPLRRNFAGFFKNSGDFYPSTIAEDFRLTHAIYCGVQAQTKDGKYLIAFANDGVGLMLWLQQAKSSITAKKNILPTYVIQEKFPPLKVLLAIGEVSPPEPLHLRGYLPDYSRVTPR